MPLRPACARVVVAPGPAVWPDRARDGPSPDPQPRPFETLEGPFAFHGPVGPEEVRRGSTQELTGASGGRPCGGRPPIYLPTRKPSYLPCARPPTPGRNQARRSGRNAVARRYLECWRGGRRETLRFADFDEVRRGRVFFFRAAAVRSSAALSITAVSSSMSLPIGLRTRARKNLTPPELVVFAILPRPSAWE